MEDIERFYGGDPAAFAEETDRQKMPQAFLAVRDTFLDYVDSEADGTRILDAGCGPGHDADYFVEQGYDAIGVDVVSDVIEQAREQKRGTYRVMDINDLDFDDGTFDGVWCNTAIFHVPPEEMQDGVDELYRVLKDGGVMHISYKLGAEERGREISRERNGAEITQYRVTDAEARHMLDAAGVELDVERTAVNTDGDRLFGNYFCQK